MSEIQRRVVDLAGLGTQGGKEVVLRPLQGGLRLGEQPMPAHDNGGLPTGIRSCSDCGLERVDTQAEALLYLLGDRAHDIPYVVGHGQSLLKRAEFDREGQSRHM